MRQQTSLNDYCSLFYRTWCTIHSREKKYQKSYLIKVNVDDREKEKTSEKKLVASHIKLENEMFESSQVEWCEKFSQLQPIINYTTQWRNGNKYNWKTMSRHPSHITHIALSASTQPVTQPHTHTYAPDTLHFEWVEDKNLSWKFRDSTCNRFTLTDTMYVYCVLGGISERAQVRLSCSHVERKSWRQTCCDSLTLIT